VCEKGKDQTVTHLHGTRFLARFSPPFSLLTHSITMTKMLKSLGNVISRAPSTGYFYWCNQSKKAILNFAL